MEIISFVNAAINIVKDGWILLYFYNFFKIIIIDNNLK